MDDWMLSITAETAVLVGDLHGDLRALARVLRHAGCFRVLRSADPAAEAAAWARLEAACSECPTGRERGEFGERALLDGVHYDDRAALSRAVVFCGDVVDNRRPGVGGDDHGYGICAFSDTVERVASTVSRLCAESPRGAVTWLIGNHDMWVLLGSTSVCQQYAPHHQCAADGSYRSKFRRQMVEWLQAARAQPIVSVNGVVCCHGGLNATYVAEVTRHSRAPPADTPDRASVALSLVMRVLNRKFAQLLATVAASPRAVLDAKNERNEFEWCLRPDSPLWCRPSSDPNGFQALFDPASFDPDWACLADAFRKSAFCVAHTLQRDGIALGQHDSASTPRPVRQDEWSQLVGGSIAYVDVGMSRGFGKDHRIVQVATVDKNARFRVSRNLI